MDLGLHGRVALITGGSKGLGKAIAHELGKEGCHVSICARGKQDLEQTAIELRERLVKVVAVEADVTRLSDVRQVVDRTITEFNGIDILVNNAGDAWLNHALSTSDEDWRYSIEVNLLSAVRFTREVVPHMRKQAGGRIINVSTIAARTPFPFTMDYLTAKAGMLAFSKAASFELAPDRILVNCVCPGFISSPLHDRLCESAIPLFGNTRAEVAQNVVNQFVALKRVGTADDVFWGGRFSRFRASFIHHRQYI